MKRANQQGPKLKRVGYVALLWLALLVGFWFYARSRGETPVSLLRNILSALQDDPLAPLFLLLIYLVRPLFLLPVGLLTVAVGLLFGVFWGTVYALLAALLTAAVAYWLGRLFGRGLPAAQAGWLGRLKQYPFETVLLCRFLAVPGDLVNYAAGYLKIGFAAFLGATAIGGSPGLLVAVLAGASLTSLTERSARFSLDWRYLLASALLLALSLGVSWLVRRRGGLKV